jgi:hypothetical protein
MKTTIYIAVRGGVVQGVRLDHLPSFSNVCYVVDYDNRDTDAETEAYSEEDYERSVLDGRTWDEIAATSEGVW